MTIRRLGLLGTVCAIALALATPIASATTAGLGNGGFEIPKIAPLNTATLPPGSTIGTCGIAMPGSPGYQFGCWRVFGGNVDVVGANHWEPSAGKQSLALNGTTNGQILQAFPAPGSRHYHVNFRLSGDPRVAGTVTLLVVYEQFDISGTYISGSLVGSYSFDTSTNSTSDMGYVRETGTFTTAANAAYADIEFQSTTTNSTYPWWGPVIDQVALRSTKAS